MQWTFGELSVRPKSSFPATANSESDLLVVNTRTIHIQSPEGTGAWAVHTRWQVCSMIYCPPLTVTKAAEGPSREAELSAHVSATFTLPMSTKKRARPSPAADAAQPEIDDAALRKALGDQKRAKSKAPFADGACLEALTQTAAPSIGDALQRAGAELLHQERAHTKRGGPILPGHQVRLLNTAAASQSEQVKPSWHI